MKKIKHILLDLDGTLTDPKEGITKSIQYALTQMDAEVPHQDELEWCIGPPLTDAFAKLLATDDKAAIQKAIDHYRDRYVGICEIENMPYHGIDITLAELGKHGFSLYLATSKPWVYAGKILEHFDLRQYFTKVHGSELDGTRDYKHELIAYILEQNKLHPAQCLMIGDRKHDVLGAKHHAIQCVGVTYGYGSHEELQQAGADHICHHHSELIELLKKHGAIS